MVNEPSVFDLLFTAGSLYIMFQSEWIHQGDNFGDFLLASKGSFFPFRVDLFSLGMLSNFSELSPENV